MGWLDAPIEPDPNVCRLGLPGLRRYLVVTAANERVELQKGPIIRDWCKANGAPSKAHTRSGRDPSPVLSKQMLSFGCVLSLGTLPALPASESLFAREAVPS